MSNQPDSKRNLRPSTKRSRPRVSRRGVGVSKSVRTTRRSKNRTRTTAKPNRTRTRHTVQQAKANPTRNAGQTTKRTTPSRSSSRRRHRHQGPSPILNQRLTQTDEVKVVLPEVKDADTVRIIPISGVEEIGRNMNVVETKDDIIIFDAGFQFVSKEGNAPGIDYILPNTQYLEERQHKIRALVITHGHLDHIGGIPFILERIGNPPVYTQYLTSLMILKRQEEFPHLDPIEMTVVTEGDSFTVGKTKIKTFPVTHSIPDAMGVSVETKHGDVVITGDVKLSHENGEVIKEERESWQAVGKNNNLALVCDSTNADREGFSAPESEVIKNLDSLIKNAGGRVIIGTFASQFDRLFNIINSCQKYGKLIVLEGRSIKTNIEIAIVAKLLEVDKKIFITATDIDDYPSDRIVILSTGAQGEEFAALMRIATDQHKFITLNERDTIVLSSSVIPGNEVAVQKLKDNIYRKNVRVANYRSSSVHSSGHGNAGELNWIRQTLKPKFLIPVHGHHFQLKSHMYTAIDNGFPKDNIVVPDNGTLIDIKNGTELIVHKKKAPTELMMVDGSTVGVKQEIVLRDRMSLSKDGMFVIIATINTKTGRLRKSPDIISRGFVYLRENQQLLSEARTLIKKTIEKNVGKSNLASLDLTKDEITTAVSNFLLQKTNKNPMVIPVLIGV